MTDPQCLKKAFTWKNRAFSDFVIEFSKLGECHKFKELYNYLPTSHHYCFLLLNIYFVPEYYAGSFTSMVSFNAYIVPTRYSHFMDEETEHQRG